MNLMTYDIFTFGLIVAWILVALWAGRASWKHHDKLNHARKVGQHLRPMDQRMWNLGREASVYRKEFRIGQALRKPRKPKYKKRLIKGIPKHLQYESSRNTNYRPQKGMGTPSL